MRVLVSAGPRQTVISQVTELNLEDASARLTQNGTFALTVQTEEAYSEAPAGTVIDQSIPAGTAVNEGETIVLTVSIGARPEETTRRPAGIQEVAIPEADRRRPLRRQPPRHRHPGRRQKLRHNRRPKLYGPILATYKNLRLLRTAERKRYSEQFGKSRGE